MNVEIVNRPLKTRSKVIFIDEGDTIVTLERGTLLFPVIDIHSGNDIGYYLLGDIYVGADTIIETKEGAVGSSIEKTTEEAFVSSKNYDFSHTKSVNLWDRKFRKIEEQAYDFFDKLSKNRKILVNEHKVGDLRIDLPDELNNCECYVHFLEPDEFILLKRHNKIISISKEDDLVLVCDKNKNSYVKISKKDGVKVYNHTGQRVVVNGKEGVIINGKNLKTLFKDVFSSFSTNFRRFD